MEQHGSVQANKILEKKLRSLLLDLQTTESGLNITLSKAYTKETSKPTLTMTHFLQKKKNPLSSNESTSPNNDTLYELLWPITFKLPQAMLWYYRSLCSYNIVLLCQNKTLKYQNKCYNRIGHIVDKTEHCYIKIVSMIGIVLTVRDWYHKMTLMSQQNSVMKQ